MKKNFFYLAIFLLIIFFGTRAYVGWDWLAYKPEFDLISISNFNFEKGFSLYTLAIKNIFSNYHFYIFINSLIDFLLLQWLFKKYSLHPLLSLFLFFTIQGIPLEMDLLRNIKSILLFLISLEYICKKNFWIFFLLNLVGFFFHMSSILYFPLYFILDKTWDKKWTTKIFFIGMIYYFIQPKLLIKILSQGPEKILNYLVVIPESFFLGPIFFFLERVIGFLFLTFLYDKIKEYRYKNIITNSFYLWTFIFLFTSELSILSVRVGILFVYSNWLLWPMLIDVTSEKIRKWLIFSVILIAIFRFYNQFSFRGNQMVYSYENIFFSPMDFQTKKDMLQEASKYRDEAHGRELLLLY